MARGQTVGFHGDRASVPAHDPEFGAVVFLDGADEGRH
jgi:hypothetical protein